MSDFVKTSTVYSLNHVWDCISVPKNHEKHLLIPEHFVLGFKKTCTFSKQDSPTALSEETTLLEALPS